MASYLTVMRILVVLAALTVATMAGATPAAAQPRTWQSLTQARDADQAAQADAARRRDIEITNELSRLDAQARTDQALQPGQAGGLQLTAPAFNPKAPPSVTPNYVEIPDAELAASNARILAAAANRK